MRLRMIHTVPVEHPNNKNKLLMLRGGEEHEIGNDLAQRMLDYGAAERVEEDDAAEDPEAVPRDELDLPERPSNGATKDAWRDYLGKLNEATKAEFGELEVPADATRDAMIAIGDARVTEWNEV